MNAALNASRADGTPVELHLSTRLPGDLWTVEVRLPTSEGSEPFIESMEGETLHLPGEGRAHLLAPYRTDQRDAKGGDTPIRLWIATLSLPASLEHYLSTHGFPIRYKYVRQEWPLEYYQTVYATERGSAEMPSAGRAFTPEIITRMVAQGVLILPLLLHTGVASLEEGEAPYEEYYRVPASTARAINQTRLSGGRVIAVGTTTMRALETVTGKDGVTHAGEGWTDLVITPEHPVRSADGLLTGLHEPRSSHLAMLSALAGVEPLREAYAQALEKKYRWHEFGDLHLILP
jgi:S-adenosylmethionine:tRNA ribosyltransferase-isomerase